MKRSTWMAMAGSGMLAVALLAWAFAPRAVEVEAVAAALGPFETAVEEDGRTRVRQRYAVTAPMAGRLRRLSLREGDVVQLGQALAMIEPLPPALMDERSQREQQARAAAAQAALERAGTRVRAAQVGVEQALTEQRRSAQLVTQGFVSPAKADADRLALDAATREREAAVDSERVARFEVQQARVALDLAAGAAAPGRTYTVPAPVSGTVLRLHQASEGVVGAGTPLLELADLRHIEIVAELLTADAAQSRPGSPVRIERWGGPGSLAGRVRRVEPAAFTKVSALGVEEQRVNVLIDLVPVSPVSAAASAAPVVSAGLADAVPGATLGDGWRVVVHILTRQEQEVLRVPVSAVFPWPGAAPGAAPAQDAVQRMAVFVVEGGRARLRFVQVTARNGTLAWVGSGLAAGDLVIAYPPPQVADGVKVRVRRG